MAKSAKLVAIRRGRVLLVKRRADRLWMLPGGRRRGRETAKECLKRELKEELPKLRTGRLKLWKEVAGKNKMSGRRMSDAVFIASKPSGKISVGDANELVKSAWCRPEEVRLTPTSRHVLDRLLPRKARRKKRERKR